MNLIGLGYLLFKNNMFKARHVNAAFHTYLFPIIIINKTLLNKNLTRLYSQFNRTYYIPTTNDMNIL